MANHRAPRRSASATGSTDGTLQRMSSPAAAVSGPVSSAGKRKAVKPSRSARTLGRAAQTSPTKAAAGSRSGSRKALFPLLPSAPTAVGAAALMIAATGAVTFSGSAEELAAASTKRFVPASALTGTSQETSRLELDSRTQAVSRDSERAALDDASDEELQEAVEAQAEERSAALAQLAKSAERYAGEIAANGWQLPVASFSLSARFGSSSGLWAHTHTGLDFAAPSGTPVVSVARGTVRSTEYAGSYGNRIIVVLEDGTEIWYAHLSSFTVSPGESVDPGEQLGTVGSTGNSTGPHLHLEVRPGAGDPVDPYAALLAHGLSL